MRTTRDTSAATAAHQLAQQARREGVLEKVRAADPYTSLSAAALASKLNEMGVPTRRGRGVWTAKAVLEVRPLLGDGFRRPHHEKVKRGRKAAERAKAKKQGIPLSKAAEIASRLRSGVKLKPGAREELLAEIKDSPEPFGWPKHSVRRYSLLPQTFIMRDGSVARADGSYVKSRSSNPEAMRGRQRYSALLHTQGAARVFFPLTDEEVEALVRPRSNWVEYRPETIEGVVAIRQRRSADDS